MQLRRYRYYHQFQRVGAAGIDWGIGIEVAEESQKEYHRQWAIGHTHKATL